MLLIKKGETNMKYLFIVTIIAIFVGGIMLGAFELMECPYWWPSIQTIQLPKDETAGCKNLCGDGVCQEIVCMAIDCPCAETKENCPQDCIKYEKYCEKDEDCACGKHKTTGECFYGNKDYVNTLQQCPDFCTGIGGNLAIECINQECKQVTNQ